MTIFYFTATGNSLYVAKKIGGKLVSIPRIMATRESAYNDDAVGIVYPCYAGGTPRIVQRFLGQVRLSADYVFAVMTYGNEQTSALDQVVKYAAKQNIHFNYTNSILMVNNYLPMFKTEDELEKEKGIENAIAGIVQDVRDKKHNLSPTSVADKFWGAVFRSGADKMTGENADRRFTVGDTCTQCGICEKVCPVSDISVHNRDVIFRHQCEGCLACIHHCPVGALHVKGEKSLRRFRNENIELNEIISANEQSVSP